jgi:Protocatechuate 3,4-dioxygenase beta subunit N terminal
MNPTTEFFQRDRALQLPAFTRIYETSVLRSPRIPPLFDIIPT